MNLRSLFSILILLFLFDCNSDYEPPTTDGSWFGKPCGITIEIDSIETFMDTTTTIYFHLVPRIPIQLDSMIIVVVTVEEQNFVDSIKIVNFNNDDCLVDAYQQPKPFFPETEVNYAYNFCYRLIGLKKDIKYRFDMYFIGKEKYKTTSSGWCFTGGSFIE